MGSLKSLAQGFLVATGLIWLLNIAALMLYGDAWLGLMYLLILCIPISGIILLKIKNNNKTQNCSTQKWRNLLFSFQGLALGFWMFDIITTFYAINVTRLAIELNPMGWPWGILGALAFCGPVLAFAYILLFRFKEKIGLYAALPLTLLTLGMGVMNLAAGFQNFQVFVMTASLAADMRFGLLALILSTNLAVFLAIRHLVARSNYRFNLKKS